MCSLASLRTGGLCQSNEGVGGGDEVIHSNDHPPHGSAGAFSPLTRLINMLATMMKFEKKNRNALTDMKRFQSAAHSGRFVKSSVVMK